MTVPSERSEITHQTDGVSKVFPVPFLFLKDSDLGVTLTAPGSESRLLVLGTDYSVAGASNQLGGKVTTKRIEPAGQWLRIERTVPLTQETAFQANDPFPAKAHERALDKLTMICQQISRWLGGGNPDLSRALMLGQGDVSGSGAYRANQNRIRNLGDPVGEQDAVNLRSLIEKIAQFSTEGGTGLAVLTLLAMASGATRIGYTSADGAVTVFDALRSLEDFVADEMTVPEFDLRDVPDNARQRLANQVYAADIVALGDNPYVLAGSLTNTTTYFNLTTQRVEVDCSKVPLNLPYSVGYRYYAASAALSTGGLMLDAGPTGLWQNYGSGRFLWVPTGSTVEFVRIIGGTFHVTSVACPMRSYQSGATRATQRSDGKWDLTMRASINFANGNTVALNLPTGFMGADQSDGIFVTITEPAGMSSGNFAPATVAMATRTPTSFVIEVASGLGTALGNSTSFDVLIKGLTKTNAPGLVGLDTTGYTARVREVSFVFAGQSLMDEGFGRGNSFGSFCAVLAAGGGAKSAWGIDCAFGGSGMTLLDAGSPSSTNYWVDASTPTLLADGPLLTESLTAIENRGGDLNQPAVSFILWDQGQQSSTYVDSGENAFSKELYKQATKYAWQRLRQAIGADVPIVVQPIGRRLAFSANPGGMQVIREAQRELVAEVPGAILGAETWDLPLKDTIHPSNRGYETMGERIANTVLRRIYGVAPTAATFTSPWVESVTEENGGDSFLVRFGMESGDLLARPQNPCGFSVHDMTGQARPIRRVEFSGPSAVRVWMRRPVPQGKLYFCHDWIPDFRRTRVITSQRTGLPVRPHF